MGIPNYWRGDALSVSQIDSVTVTGTANGTGFANFTINSKLIAVAIVANQTAAEVGNNIYAALFGNTSTVPEIGEQSYGNDGAGNLTITSTPGEPFAMSLANTAGIGLGVAYANVQNASGPSWVTTVTNWSLGHVPTAGEDAVFAGGAAALYGWGNLTWTPDNIIFKATYEEAQGLPPYNTRGITPYYEYRARAMPVPCPLVIGEGTGGSGPTRVVANVTVDTANVTVYTTSTSQTGAPAVELYDLSGAAHTLLNLNVFGGDVQVGQNRRLTGCAVIANLRQTAGTLTVKGNVAAGNIGNIGMTGGCATVACSFGNLNISGGELTIAEESAVTGTITATGGTVYYDAMCSLGVVSFFGGGGVQPAALVCNRNTLPKSIGNQSAFTGGAVFTDPEGVVAFAGVVNFDLASINASQMGRRIAVARTNL